MLQKILIKTAACSISQFAHFNGAFIALLNSLTSSRKVTNSYTECCTILHTIPSIADYRLFYTIFSIIYIYINVRVCLITLCYITLCTHALTINTYTVRILYILILYHILRLCVRLLHSIYLTIVPSTYIHITERTTIIFYYLFSLHTENVFMQIVDIALGIIYKLDIKHKIYHAPLHIITAVHLLD